MWETERDWSRKQDPIDDHHSAFQRTLFCCVRASVIVWGVGVCVWAVWCVGRYFFFQFQLSAFSMTQGPTGDRRPHLPCFFLFQHELKRSPLS